MMEINKETDYRNIPREMLDKNIPTGRGMVKWVFLLLCQNNLKQFINI